MSSRRSHQQANKAVRSPDTATARRELQDLASVIDEVERFQHTKLVLEHLASLAFSEFLATDAGPPRVTIGVDGAGAVPARDDVLDEVHALLFRAVAEAEAHQRRLLGSRVHVGVDAVEGDLRETGVAIAKTSCRGASTKRVLKRQTSAEPSRSPQPHRRGH